MFITGQTTNRAFQEDIKELLKADKVEVTDLDTTVKTRNFIITYDRYGNLVNTYENEGKEGFDAANPGTPIEYPNMGTDKTMDPTADDFIQYDFYRFTKSVPYGASPEYLRDALRGIKTATMDLGEEQHIEAYNNEYLTNPLDEADEAVKAGKYKETESVQLNSDFSQINLAVLAKLNSAGDVETGSVALDKADIQVVFTLEGKPVRVNKAAIDGVEGTITEEYAEFRDVTKGAKVLAVTFDTDKNLETTIDIVQDETFIVELD